MSRVFAQATAFAVAPLLTRLFEPEDFGVLSIYAAVVAILLVISSLKYELAIPVESDSEQAANLVILGFGATALLSALVTVVFTVGNAAMARLLGVQSLGLLVWAIPLGLLFAGGYQTATYWAIRHKSFNTIARFAVLQCVVKAIIQLSAGVAGFGAGGLVLGDVASRLVGYRYLAADYFRHRFAAAYPMEWRKIWAVAVRHNRYPKYAAVAGLLNAASLELPIMMVAVGFGPATAGLFGLTQRVVATPMMLIGQAVAQVYLAEISGAIRGGSQRMAKMLLKTVTFLAIIGAPLAITLAAAGAELFGFVFGQEWYLSGRFAEALGVMILFQLMTSPVSQTLNVIGRQDIQLICDVGRLAAVCGVFAYSLAKDMTALDAITLYANSMVIVYGATLAVIGFVMRKKAGQYALAGE